MRKLWYDIALGMFFLLTFVALLFAALWMTSGSQEKVSSYTLHGYFDDVSGLKKRSSVRMAGVIIGEVKNISLQSDNYRAKVEIAIFDDELRIPSDSSVSVMTEGLLGSKYLQLEPGDEDTNLSDGDKIIYTHSSVVLENVLGIFLTGMMDKGGSK